MDRSKLLWALAVLNVALAVILIARFTPENKLFGQAARRPGDYVMIPGTLPNAANGVVYVIDTANGSLGAIGFDDNRHSITSMAPIDLSRVFEDRGGGVVNPPRRGGVLPPK